MNTSAEPRPVIKGIFVNSHIRVLARERGDTAVATLERRFGRRLQFSASEDVPVRDEVRLLELALDLFSDTPIPESEREFEAGRLHFRNFTTTPFAKIIFSKFRRSLKIILMQSQHIAGHVFRGVRFSSFDIAPTVVRIKMENNDCPLDHFKGFFTEWLSYAGFRGTVEASEVGTNVYEYTIRWDQNPKK